MDGGLGLDTLLYSGSPTGLTVNLGNASTSPQTASGGHGTGDAVAAFKHVTGSTFADNLTGSSVVNVLKGTGGNDTLSGAAGNDNLVGAAGIDRFDGGADTDNCDRVAGETASGCETQVDDPFPPCLQAAWHGAGVGPIEGYLRWQEGQEKPSKVTPMNRN